MYKYKMNQIEIYQLQMSNLLLPPPLRDLKDSDPPWTPGSTPYPCPISTYRWEMDKMDLQIGYSPDLVDSGANELQAGLLRIFLI